MHRYKCTYWANSIKYNGDLEAETIEGAKSIWKRIIGFQMFEDSPYKVNL